ncbi:hypothetical protein PINS_up014631 [Pythium insidiosum]|nr:hypothetical protein PINS_up014631 [Pythium insidiosum]
MTATAHTVNDGMQAAVTEIVATLRDAGTKLVCIDFDATFVSVHTSGEWTSSAEELSRHARAVFLEMVPKLCEAGVHVAVVTFSPQVELIRAVLSICFGCDVAGRLIVRCDDESWALLQSDTFDFVPKWQVCGMHFDRAYKLPYVISAAIQASQRSGESIRNRDTVLFDDDAKNIRIAIDNGISGVYFEAEGVEAGELCRRIKKLHATPSSLSTTSAVLQTPLKRKAVRILQTPEPTTAHAPPPTHGGRVFETPIGPSVPRKKRFSMCTPSPVMKLKCTVDMGRPKSKRAARLRQGPRNISDELHELHLAQAAAESLQPSPPPSTSKSPRSKRSVSMFSLQEVDSDQE